MFKISKLLLPIFLFLAFIPNQLYSQTYQLDSFSGLSFDQGITKTGSQYKTIYRFQSYSTSTSTEVFNNLGSTTTYAGMVYVAGYDDKHVDIIQNCLAAGTTTYKLYTAVGTPTVWANTLTIELYGTTTYSLPIIEKSEHMRWGISNDGNGAIVTLREMYTR